MNAEATCSPCGRSSVAPHHDPRAGFFDRHAHQWDADTAARDQTLHRLHHLRERLGLRPGLRVLETGCGTGLVTGFLAQITGADCVVAVDFSPAMLAQARAKSIAANFRQLDICRESPAERAFDLALCFHAFPHFRDQAAALRNIAASLKTGGRLVVLHLAGSEHINTFHRQVGGAVGNDLLPAREAWPLLLAQAGLVLQSLEDRLDLFLLEAARK